MLIGGVFLFYFYFFLSFSKLCFCSIVYIVAALIADEAQIIGNRKEIKQTQRHENGENNESHLNFKVCTNSKRERERN